ncbi:uncharacterized protein AAGF69_008062 isoform 2-T2 [Amazona ochrocephala]
MSLKTEVDIQYFPQRTGTPSPNFCKEGLQQFSSALAWDENTGKIPSENGKKNSQKDEEQSLGMPTEICAGGCRSGEPRSSAQREIRAARSCVRGPYSNASWRNRLLLG